MTTIKRDGTTDSRDNAGSLGQINKDFSDATVQQHTGTTATHIERVQKPKGSDSNERP